MPKKEKQGIVVSNKMDKTVVVKVAEYNPHPKYKKIIEFNIIDFFFKMTMGIKMFNVSFNISDINITQDIVKSNEYNIMLMSKSIYKDENKLKNNDNKKMLIFEFEINSNENYTYKVILKNEKKIV